MLCSLAAFLLGMKLQSRKLIFVAPRPNEDLTLAAAFGPFLLVMIFHKKQKLLRPSF